MENIMKCPIYQKLIKTAHSKDSCNITQTMKKMQQNIQIQQMKFMIMHADLFCCSLMLP